MPMSHESCPRVVSTYLCSTFRQFVFHRRARGSGSGRALWSIRDSGAGAWTPDSGPSAAPRGRARFRLMPRFNLPRTMAGKLTLFSSHTYFSDLSRTSDKVKISRSPRRTSPRNFETDHRVCTPPPDVGTTRHEKSLARKSATPPLQVLWHPSPLPAAPYSSLFPPRDLSDSTCVHQGPSVAIRGNQSQSKATRLHSPGAIRGNPRRFESMHLVHARLRLVPKVACTHQGTQSHSESLRVTQSHSESLRVTQRQRTLSTSFSALSHALSPCRSSVGIVSTPW
jgi:hypothetical protein